MSELQREVDAFSKQVDSIASITAEMNSGRGLHSQRDLYAKANQLKKMREERDNSLKELNALKEKVTEAQGELLDIEANIEYRTPAVRHRPAGEGAAGSCSCSCTASSLDQRSHRHTPGE